MASNRRSAARIRSSTSRSPCRRTRRSWARPRSSTVDLGRDAEDVAPPTSLEPTMKPLHVLGLVAATLLAFCIAAVTPTYGAPFGEVRFGAYVNPLGLSVVTGGKTPDIDDCSR